MRPSALRPTAAFSTPVPSRATRSTGLLRLTRGLGALLLALMLLTAVGGAAAAQDAGEGAPAPAETLPQTPADPPVAPAAEPAAPTGEFVVAIAFACPSAGADLADCESLAGVTISVLVGGAELPNGPLTTKLNPLNANAIEFWAPVDQTVTLTQIGGLPAGYGPVAGSDPLVSLVSDLPNGSCGGESTCRYATLVNVPLDGNGNGGGEPTDPAPQTATLTVYSALCPAPVAPGDLFASCYDNPGVGVPFRVGRPNTEFPETNTPTDAAGFASFPIVGEQARIIQELPFAGDVSVYCTLDGVETAVTVVDSGNPALGVADVATGGGDVRCDWYNNPRSGGEAPGGGPAGGDAGQPAPAPGQPAPAPGNGTGAPAGNPGGGSGAAPATGSTGNGGVAVTALPSTGAGTDGTAGMAGELAWLLAAAGALFAAVVARRLRTVER